jgi:DNA-binding transcriptional LysR family regulator
VEIKQLEAFVRVAWSSSYTLASHDLGITQPAVSARVAGLEEELGASLFVRRQGKVSLTEAGEEFRSYAEEILRMARQAGTAVQQLSGIPKAEKVLRIGCNTATSAGPLAAWLCEFRASYENPSLQIDVIVDRTPVLMSLLMEGEIELAIASPVMIDPLAQLLWTRKTTLSLVAGPDYHGKRDGLTIEQLLELEFIAFTNGAARQQLWRIERMLGAPLRVAFSSNSALLVRSMIAESSAVGFMPSETVAEDLQSGRLVTLSLAEETLETWEAALVRWRDRPIGRAAEQLVAMLPKLAAMPGQR